MLIKRLKECGEITAGDGTRLTELLHPERDPAGIRYSLAVARLAPRQSSLPHRLRTSEVYYLIQGTGEMHVDDEAAQVQAGDAVYIPPGATQWLSNNGPEEITFICIVDPAWRAEDEEGVTRQGPRVPGVQRSGEGTHDPASSRSIPSHGKPPGPA